MKTIHRPTCKGNRTPSPENTIPASNTIYAILKEFTANMFVDISSVSNFVLELNGSLVHRI